MISKSPTLPVDSQPMSRPQNTAVGSGSRPTTSRIPIKTSAPEHPQTLGRMPPGSLK
jgi:hypothetical protein